MMASTLKEGEDMEDRYYVIIEDAAGKMQGVGNFPVNRQGLDAAITRANDVVKGMKATGEEITAKVLFRGLTCYRSNTAR